MKRYEPKSVFKLSSISLVVMTLLCTLFIHSSSVKAANQAIPILMYHHLLPDDKGSGTTISPKRFKEHMEALKKAGYHTITDYDLLAYKQGEKTLPPKPILITFDDGYESGYQYAYPILKELEMKATIYVIAGRIKDDYSNAEKQVSKISWEQAIEMKGTILIQSHTFDLHYQTVNKNGTKRGALSAKITINGKLESQAQYEKRVLEDMESSKRKIEEKLGYPVVSLAYPYGQYGLDTIRLAKKAGYQLGFKAMVSKDKSKTPLFELNRIIADGRNTSKVLLEQIRKYK